MYPNMYNGLMNIKYLCICFKKDMVYIWALSKATYRSAISFQAHIHISGATVYNYSLPINHSTLSIFDLFGVSFIWQSKLTPPSNKGIKGLYGQEVVKFHPLLNLPPPPPPKKKLQESLSHFSDDQRFLWYPVTMKVMCYWFDNIHMELKRIKKCRICYLSKCHANCNEYIIIILNREEELDLYITVV